MSEVEQHLDKAIVAHGQWKMRLKRAIDTGSSEFVPATVSRDDQCELGKWLHTGATAQEKSSPYYGQTVQAHKQFHTVAGGVLANALAGKKDEAVASMAPGGDFARASVAVTQALQAWKRTV
jgi:Chemoreceptor zinc-binding domain